MTTLLINPYFLSEDPAELRVMKPYPPLGLMYLSAWLKREGIIPEIFDGTFSNISDLKKILLQQKSGITAFYATLMTRANVLEIIRFIRSVHELGGMKIILGGPDARHNAAGYLNAGADYIIPGEGEIPLTALIRAIDSGFDLTTIPGTICKSLDGEMITNSEPVPVEMESLPYPDRKSFDVDLYLDAWRSHHGITSVTINTMRGCPYSCNWCSKSVFGNRFRRRSPRSVVNEMALIREQYNPDQLWFTDDVFTLGKDWLRDFVTELEKQQVRIPFECISRTDCLDQHTLGLLARAGCRKLWIGAESGSQKIIDRMNRKIKITDTILVMQNARQLGISAGTFIMLGYPGEKKKDILLTARFLKSALPDEFTTGIAYPIKGTLFYTEAEPGFLSPYIWDKQNERQIRVKRSYSSLFYRISMRYLFYTWTAAGKRTCAGKIFPALKAVIFKILMLLCP